MTPRPADIDDAEAIAIVHRAARDAAMPWLPAPHTPEDDVALFRESVLPKSDVWLVEAGGVAAFIAMTPGWIDHLYVSPSHWRRGMGAGLLELAKGRHEALELWTFQRNQRARNFYERFGFSVVQTTDGAGNEEYEPDMRYVWRASS